MLDVEVVVREVEEVAGTEVWPRRARRVSGRPGAEGAEVSGVRCVGWALGGMKRMDWWVFVRLDCGGGGGRVLTMMAGFCVVVLFVVGILLCEAAVSPVGDVEELVR